MSSEYPVLQYLTSGTRKLFGFKKGEFRFNGGDFYRLFKLRAEEKRTGVNNLLSDKDRLEYSKCYAVAVGSIINRWYKKPDTAFDEEFQIKFFHEGVAYLSRYYEKKPDERFFNQFKNPPKTESEEESIANWVIQKAEWYLKSVSKAWYKKLYKRQCIDYDALQIAREEYKQQLEVGLYPEEVNIDNFRDKECWKQVHSGSEKFDTYIDSQASTLDTHEFHLIEDFIHRLENSEALTKSYDLDSTANRLRLDHQDRIKKLYSIFSINQIEEIKSVSMWEVQRIELDIDSVYMIFQALEHGYQLSLDGKQFLLLQYLRIAIEVLRHYEDFTIDDDGTTIHSPSQMAFLGTVIGQAYTYFNNKFDSVIIQPLSKITPNSKDDEKKLPKERKEKLFSIISKYILKNIDSRFEEYNSKKTQLTLKAYKTENVHQSSMDYVLKLEKAFGNFDNFDRFIHKLILQQSVPSLFDIEDFILKFGAQTSTKDIKAIMRSIISSLGYEIIEKGETENGFIYRGRGGKFADQTTIDSSERIIRIGLSINTGDKPTQQEVVDQYNMMRKESIHAPTLISTSGFQDIVEDYHCEDESLRKYSRVGKIDLLKLAELIKENYHRLPDSEKERIQTLIEELVTDF